MTSEDIVGQIARCVRHKCEISFGGVRVAIDGRDATGKTTLTDRLSEALQGEVGEVPRALASTVGATPKSCGSRTAARTQRATISTPLTSSIKMRSLSALSALLALAAFGGIGLPGLAIWPARGSSQLPTRPTNRSSFLSME